MDESDGLRVYVASGSSTQSISIRELTCPPGDVDSCAAIEACEDDAKNHRSA